MKKKEVFFFFSSLSFSKVLLYLLCSFLLLLLFCFHFSFLYFCFFLLPHCSLSRWKWVTLHNCYSKDFFLFLERKSFLALYIIMDIIITFCFFRSRDGGRFLCFLIPREPCIQLWFYFLLHCRRHCLLAFTSSLFLL